MRIFEKLRFALRSFVTRGKFETDMNEEIADFLERDARARIAKGVSADEAVRAARVEMRGVYQTVEQVRDLRPGIWFETLWQDIRFATRILLKRPAYVALVLSTMALGIGANTAIFSLIHAVLLQPLPFQNPERLMLLQTQNREQVVPQVSYLDFQDVKNQHPGIERATLFLYEAFVLEQRNSDGVTQPMRKFGLRITTDFFATLGVQPSFGRGFLQKERVSGNDLVAIISNRLWKENFAANKNVLGSQTVINEQTYTIIGVMPKSFDFFLPMSESFTIQDIDIYVPLPEDHYFFSHRSIFALESIARLRENVTHQKAAADISQISKRLGTAYPETNADRTLLITPLRDQIVGGSRPALYLLSVAVLAVLLVACANLANLMIGRMAMRNHELAVCAALGASRARLIRRLLVENFLLVGLGGIIGITVAYISLPIITDQLASRLPGAATIGLNGPVLIFAVFACLLTTIASGLVPVKTIWTRNRRNSETLHGEGRATAGSARAGMRKGLVITEISLSCILLCGAILLASSFISLMSSPTGFDSTHLLTFQIRLSESRYVTRKQVAQTLNQFTQDIITLRGAEKATVSSSLPLSGHSSGTAVWIEGRIPPGGRQPAEARWQFVQPGYFETMRIPLLSGRLFQPGDLDRKTHVTLISQSVALRDFANENPIGKHVSYGPPGNETDWHEIIGIVGDVRHETLREEPVPRVYDLLGQHADLNLFTIVRTSHTEAQIMPEVRAVLSKLDPGAPIYDIRTMDGWKANSANREQTLATTVTLFAAVTLFLGAVGAYGVISSLVAQRTREIGIRIALGALPKTILRSTIYEGMQLTIAGLAIGLLTSLIFGPLIRGLLFGIKYSDPRIFFMVIATLLAVSFAACYIPARRAARVEPVTALRAE